MNRLEERKARHLINLFKILTHLINFKWISHGLKHIELNYQDIHSAYIEESHCQTYLTPQQT